MYNIKNGFSLWDTNENAEFLFFYDDLFNNFPKDDEITGLHCHIMDKKTMIHVGILKIDKYSVVRQKREGLGDIICINAKIEPNILIIPSSFAIHYQKQYFGIMEYVVEHSGKDQKETVIRIRFYPKDTDETYEGTLIEETLYSYLVIPDDNLIGTARWNKKYCEVL